MDLKTIFSSVSKTVFETMAKIHCVVPQSPMRGRHCPIKIFHAYRRRKVIPNDHSFCIMGKMWFTAPSV